MVKIWNKALSVIVLLMIVVGLFSPAIAVERAHAAEAPADKWVTFKYDDFGNSSPTGLIQRNGSASFSGSVLRLTSAAGGQAGSVFSKQRIYNSGNNYSFSTFFAFKISSPGGDGSFAIGADGFTFAIQTVSNTAGGVGSGIGIGGVNPSVAVKFDTFQNGPAIGNLHDPSDNYIGLETNGNVDNTNPNWYADIPKSTLNMKDGNVHYAWIDYDGNAKTMSVYIGNAITRPATPVLVAPGVDLASNFNGADGVFAGFTSATGSSWENHDILSWYFTNKLDPIDTQNTNYVYRQAPSKVSVASAVYGQSEPGKTAMSASAKDENGLPVVGVPITFNTGSGTIEDLNGNPIAPVPAVAYTDANGNAQVILDMGTQPVASPGQVNVVAEGGAYSTIAIPSSPSLSKTNASATGLTLNWTSVPGATLYHVFDNGSQVASVASGPYNVTGLDPDDSHVYYVTADAGGVQSAPSNPVSAATPAPVLTATPSSGTEPGTTKADATAGTGNHLVAQVSSSPIATPNIGAKAPTEGVINPYTPGSDIEGVDPVTNKYVGLYEVDGNGRIVSFKLIALAYSDINPLPAPTLDATPTEGSQPATTAVNAAAGTGHHLAVQVSNSPIATPNVGDSAPTGAGMTNPYAPGSDIGGVDAANHKYLGVYELDSNNKVVSFKLITLTGGEIKPTPAPELNATTSKGSQPGTTAVNAEAGTDRHLAIQVSSSEIARPNVGDPAPSGEGVVNPYTKGGDIGGIDAANHKYVGVYELDDSDKVVSFKLITLTGSEISPIPAPELDVTPLVGSQPGTVQMSAEAGSGNHLVVQVSNLPVATPYVGDPAPSGTGVTNPYTPGTDIGGVDLATNRYVTIYEVDSANRVVAFKLYALDEYYTDLKLDWSGGAMKVGDTQSVDVKAVYLDQSTIDVTDKASYHSSNPSVATVDANGVITAVGTGTAEITVSYGGKVATKTIRVQDGTPTMTLTLDGPNSVVGDGRSSVTLTAKVVNISDGSPVADKTVTFGGINGESKTVKTDSRGMATVTFTPQAITGVTPVHRLITASATDSNGLTVEKNIGIDYMPASINGVLVDQVTGQPIRNAVVSVQADFNGDGVVDFSQEVVTGPDGSYKIAVPRGNWTYTLDIRTPVTIDGQTTTVRKTQVVDVGAIGTGQEVPTENKISGQLIVSKASANPSGQRPSLGDLFGTGNVTALVENVGGGSYRAEVPLDADGNFEVAQVPQGKYKLSYRIKAPDGTRLAGPSLIVEVKHNGEMGVVYSLIDPYGVVTDAATGLPLNGVHMSLYWADTDLNKSNGHQAGTLVQLPPLPNFLPHQNANPQTTDDHGEYAWMVYPEGDYYIVAEKPGYDAFNTLQAKTTVPASAGSDSYIDNGIIHVGQDMVAFSFSLSRTSSGGGSAAAAPAAPAGVTVGGVTSSSAVLNWNAVSGASSYNIYDNGKLIASGVTGTTFTLTGLAAGSEHAITVSAIVNGMESPPSQVRKLVTAGAQASAEGHHEAYIFGYPDGTFKPQRDVTRREVAALLSRAFRLPTADAGQAGYSDVTQSDWGAQSIADVTKAGYMSGYPDGTFRPNQPITRAELAAIAARIKQLTGEGADAFSDVAGSWAKAAIDSAAEAGILTGYPDGTFRPKANITRAEAVTIINRLLNRGPLAVAGKPTWSDVASDHWAFGPIEEASRDHDYSIQDGKEVEVKQAQLK